MAPSAARMPQRIAPPSNAGPAGAAVDRIRSPSLRTISQLVPTSMNSRIRLSRSMPVASMPATMSPPTYAPRAGKSATRAPGWRVRPTSLAEHGRRRRRGLDERRDAERLGVDPERQRGHRRVAGERHLVDVQRVDPALAADLLGERGQRLGRGLLQPAEGGRVEHGRADPRDHVAAERLLLVEHRGHRDRRAGHQVEQGGDDGRRAEVEGDRVADGGGVAGLDVDERLVDDDRGHLEVGLAQHLRQPAQRVEVGERLEVVDRVEEPDQVGALVLERRLGELDVPLLDGGPQDDLPADADGGGLGPGGQRRYDDVVVAGGLHQAGQPPAGVQLGRC